MLSKTLYRAMCGTFYLRSFFKSKKQQQQQQQQKEKHAKTSKFNFFSKNLRNEKC